VLGAIITAWSSGGGQFDCGRLRLGAVLQGKGGREGECLHCGGLHIKINP